MLTNKPINTQLYLRASEQIRIGIPKMPTLLKSHFTNELILACNNNILFCKWSMSLFNFQIISTQRTTDVKDSYNIIMIIF